MSQLIYCCCIAVIACGIGLFHMARASSRLTSVHVIIILCTHTLCVSACLPLRRAHICLKMRVCVYRRMVQWLVFGSRKQRVMVSSPRNGVMSTVVLWNWISSSRCLAAMKTRRGPASTLLVDSGADDHFCHPDFAKQSPLKKECEVDTEICTRQSIISPWHTTRQSGRTQGQRANIEFQIADISDNILNSGKLLRNGFVFSLKGENDSIMCHQSAPTTTVPLFLHKRSLRIHALSSVHHVSPVVEDDMPCWIGRVGITQAGHEVGQVDAY